MLLAGRCGGRDQRINGGHTWQLSERSSTLMKECLFIPVVLLSYPVKLNARIGGSE